MRNDLAINSTLISALNEATGLMPAFLEKIKEAARDASKVVDLRGVNEAAPALSILADKIARMISVFSFIHRDCRALSSKTHQSDSIKSIEIHLLSILKAVKSAEHAKDQEMLVDLLEYELQDNLTQWKIKAIPHLRGMIQAFEAN